MYLELGEYQLHSGFFQSLFKELLNIAIHCSFAIDHPQAPGLRSWSLTRGSLDFACFCPKRVMTLAIRKRILTLYALLGAPPTASSPATVALSLSLFQNIKIKKKTPNRGARRRESNSQYIDDRGGITGPRAIQHPRRHTTYQRCLC